MLCTFAHLSLLRTLFNCNCRHVEQLLNQSDAVKDKDYNWPADDGIWCMTFNDTQLQNQPQTNQKN